jgi:hypothetical protein
MNRSLDRSSAIDAIRSWARPFASPGEALKAEQSAVLGAVLARTEPDLLLMRMEALQIDPSHVKAAAPVAFRALAHVCDYCQCKAICERDLTYEAAGRIAAWENYCPNAFRLKPMAALHAVWPRSMG